MACPSFYYYLLVMTLLLHELHVADEVGAHAERACAHGVLPRQDKDVLGSQVATEVGLVVLACVFRRVVGLGCPTEAHHAVVAIGEASLGARLLATVGGALGKALLVAGLLVPLEVEVVTAHVLHWLHHALDAIHVETG